MNLKNVSIWIVSIILISNSTLFAQEKGSHEIASGYSIATSNYWLKESESNLLTLFSFGIVQTENIKTSGAFYLIYKYTIANKWKVGAILSYEQLKEDVSSVFNTQTGQIKYGFFTAGVETDYRYISKPSFQMYSGLGIAYTFETEKHEENLNSSYSTTGYFNFHLNALGFRVGKSFALLAELGWGYKGILNMGISYQF